MNIIDAPIDVGTTILDQLIVNDALNLLLSNHELFNKYQNYIQRINEALNRFDNIRSIAIASPLYQDYVQFSTLGEPNHIKKLFIEEIKHIPYAKLLEMVYDTTANGFDLAWQYVQERDPTEAPADAEPNYDNPIFDNEIYSLTTIYRRIYYSVYQQRFKLFAKVSLTLPQLQAVQFDRNMII